MNHFPLIQRMIIVTTAMLATCLSIIQITVNADAPAPQLVISQFKITSSNGQYFTLYNQSGSTIDMSRYELQYFNNVDISKATSSKTISLSGSLAAHGYYMVSDTMGVVCYQMTVDSVSLGLSSTSGMIEVLSYAQSSPGGSIMPTLQDYVGWSKTAAAGAQTLPTSTSAFLQRQPFDQAGNPAVSASGSGSWLAEQPGSTDACKVTTTSGTVAPTVSGTLLPPVEPLALFTTTDSDIAPTPSLPAADIGLMSPLITELLPNPLGSGTDTSDEYVEFYNPNDQLFDMTGFSLQTGTSSLHRTQFSDGLQLAPKSFTAIYSKDMPLDLSNSGGQAVLLDPLGAVIAQTGVYGAAKDGQSWALGNGNWFWTATPTPGTANIITPPANKPAKTTSKTRTGQYKPVTTVTARKASKAVPISTHQTPKAASTTTIIHPLTLALVGCLALLYGAYEYRTDLGNRIYQLRNYLAARRARRLAPEGR